MACWVVWSQRGTAAWAQVWLRPCGQGAGVVYLTQLPAVWAGQSPPGLSGPRPQPAWADNKAVSGLGLWGRQAGAGGFGRALKDVSSRGPPSTGRGRHRQRWPSDTAQARGSPPSSTRPTGPWTQPPGGWPLGRGAPGRWGPGVGGEEARASSPQALKDLPLGGPLSLALSECSADGVGQTPGRRCGSWGPSVQGVGPGGAQGLGGGRDYSRFPARACSWARPLTNYSPSPQSPNSWAWEGVPGPPLPFLLPSG